VTPRTGQITELARVLDDAGQVMLFCEAGCRDAHAEVMQLADRLKPRSGAPSAARSGSSTTIPTTSG
jgi:pyruvate dehydrogenase (quinone)